MAPSPELVLSYKLKRLFDLCAGVVALVLMSPLMLLIGLLVAVFLGKPVVFRQQRPGLHGQLFTLLKFRTMAENDRETGKPVPDSERMTAFGRFLRSTSLDELPELINVLRGEMSIVGPRPLLVSYLMRYSPFQMRRHQVLPGITGWAQVNGRNAVSWERKFAMDVWYVDHQSLLLDLKIIALTLWSITRRDGIDQPGLVGAAEFMGSGDVEAIPVADATVRCHAVTPSIEEADSCRQ
ncbi:sugar transferase [Edaphobacter bradus]|uniref:sugar transferase n=1 Tax=Edaphobacter bradus TaxID=2259016 RepID=UPI00295B654E|nr:sugar transferase [Edaphobacter bradus]